MFILIPIRHEQDTVKRWPWVTFAIMGICVVAFLAMLGQVKAYERHQEETYGEAIDYFYDHPWLEPDPRLMEDDYFYERGGAELGRELHELTADVERPESRRLIQKQQQHLNKLIQRWDEAQTGHPYMRYGYRPSNFSIVRLITHMFLHAGWLHLIGNLLFLYLAAPAVEDAWGRPLFAAFYIFSGVAAALFYSLHFSDSPVPLIGASGAIAGAMGAFLVRYWAVKIKFFYAYLFFFRGRAGTFMAPSWLMLPLWLMGEMWSAYVTDHISPEGSGVAYWAHVWGFVAGAAVALVIKLTKVEETHLQSAIHAKIGFEENTAIERAHEARRTGALSDAREILEEALRVKPSDRDAAIALWDLSLQQERAPEAAPHLLRCIWEEFRSGDEDLALRHWDEVTAYAPDAKVDPRLKVRLLEGMVAEGREEEALPLATGAAEDAAQLEATMYVRLARVLEKIDGPLAGQIAAAGLSREGLMVELRDELSKIASRAPQRTSTMDLSAFADASPQEAKPAFGVLPAVPLRLGPDRIVMNLEGKGKVSLRFSRIKAIGAAQIEEIGYQPYFLLDLFIDSPRLTVDQVRVVRCLSSLFDPLEILPAETDQAAAFRAMVAQLNSGAAVAVYPESLGAFRPRPFPGYESVGGYEEAVRSALAHQKAVADSEGLSALPDLPDLSSIR